MGFQGCRVNAIYYMVGNTFTKKGGGCLYSTSCFLVYTAMLRPVGSVGSGLEPDPQQIDHTS